MVKILDATLKISDDKGHIRMIYADQIDLDSIKIKKISLPRPIPVEVKKKDEPVKTTKKSTKKNSKKNIKK